MTSKLIAHAAEAKLFLINNTVVKQRISKGYRLPSLDEKLRRQRTKREARILQKASALIPVPRVLGLDEKASSITLEYIKGKKLSEHLDALRNKKQLCTTIGAQLAKLHDTGIIHGDITTSNMILSSGGKLYFLDFGLSFESSRVEDKAVDLHLLKEALEAKHFKNAKECFSAVLQGYKASKNAATVLQRLAAVEKRGRYKQQV